jgi:outer membrane protein assembly factor BamE (lipoprotein component of BamABCDE complex)
MKATPLFAALIACIVLTPPVYADTFRCAGHIIEAGMSRDEVLEHCGSPAEENHQTVNTWTYIRENGKLDVVVYFYANGNVEKIESVRK